MSDAWAVVLALSVTAGALAPAPIPLPLPIVAACVALLLRRPALLCLAAGVAASSLSLRAHAGLAAADGRVLLHGRATLLTDPAPALHRAVKVELRLGRRHVEAFAHGAAAAELRPLLAGQTIGVAGVGRPVTGRRRSYLTSRHIALQLAIASANDPKPGAPLSRAANAVRRVLERGTARLGPEQRAMFAGFVLGDGRDEPPTTVDEFRRSGLTHLLVVSGENVAFALAMVAVPLSFFGLRGRFAGALVVLLLFGAMTRWQPSVIRAEAMAGIGLLAAYLGRPVSTIRLLALAVAGLVVIDPLLVRSVGFVLSVGACTGIALLAGPLSRGVAVGGRIRARLPLPIAVTVAAQVGVAPVVLPVFGSLPLASLPANALAVPAAGPLTMWGMAAGIPAGLVGGPVAAVLHEPTLLLMGWIEWVARWAAHLPLPTIG